MGSKRRIAKDILRIVLKDRQENQLFVEPFVGGCNITSLVTGPRLAADCDPDLICMWKAASSGWMPPKTFTEDQYNEIKNSQESPLKGYAAFALSYGGKKFGGWCRDSAGVRDYVDESYRNAQKQFKKIIGVDFVCCDYKTLNIPTGSIVYCDPPYKSTTGYNGNFDHIEFWDWCRVISINSSVFVSEYEAPDDFECVWSKSVSSSLTKNTGSKSGVERLFVQSEGMRR